MSRYVLTLDGEKPMSWNKFYSGTHWRQRHIEAERVHWLVYEALRQQHGQPDKIETPVRVVFTSYADRPLDPDNLSVKLYVDGLVHAQLLEDDTPDLIREVVTRSRKCKRAARRVVIEVEPMED